MFRSEVFNKYQVRAYEAELMKKVEDAEEELNKIEDELKKTRYDYEKLIDSLSEEAEDEESLNKLIGLEKKIDELEEEREEASKAYDSARQLTIDDLKAEQHYSDWKESR
jgi:chromosome segregation ATPase